MIMRGNENNTNFEGLEMAKYTGCRSMKSQYGVEDQGKKQTRVDRDAMVPTTLFSFFFLSTEARMYD